MKLLLGFFIAFCSMANYHSIDSGQSFDSFRAPSNTPLLETKWKLLELSNILIPKNATQKEMYFILKSDSTVKGDGGCNSFSGNYGLGKDNKISFGEMIRTNLFCAGIDYERKFLNALSKADHYEIKGDTLSLKNQMIILAKFVAGSKQ